MTSFSVTNTKTILVSKTFWGALLAIVSSVDPTLYSHILGWVNVSDPNLLTAKIVGFIGGAFAIYGRFVATQPVTLTGSPKMTKIQ